MRRLTEGFPFAAAVKHHAEIAPTAAGAARSGKAPLVGRRDRHPCLAIVAPAAFRLSSPQLFRIYEQDEEGEKYDGFRHTRARRRAASSLLPIDSRHFLFL